MLWATSYDIPRLVSVRIDTLVKKVGEGGREDPRRFTNPQWEIENGLRPDHLFRFVPGTVQALPVHVAESAIIVDLCAAARDVPSVISPLNF